MASGYTTSWHTRILNVSLRGTSPGALQQSSLWIALFTAEPGPDGSGGTEVDTSDWTNYARVEVDTSAPGSSVFASPVVAGDNSVSVELNQDVTIVNLAQVANPVTVVALALMDAQTDGNMVAWGDLAGSVLVQDNQPVVLPQGNLTVGLTYTQS